MANTKVTTGVIKDDAVGADQLAPNAVVTASMVDNAVTTAKIANDAILTAKISDNAVNNAKLSSNSVDSDQYVDGSIDTAHIADSQITSAKLDTNIAVGGTLTVGSHLNMGDNDILKMGADADLKIYHTATNNHSIIEETGGGNLVVRTNGSHIEFDKGSTEFMTRMIVDGAVELYYAGAKKLETVSGGVTVTGTATMDGLVVNGEITGPASNNLTIRSKYSATIDIDSDNNQTDRNFQVIHDGSKLILKAEESGDISFYEDTGSTAELFWDASAERLGIGTTSPDGILDIEGNFESNKALVLTNTQGTGKVSYLRSHGVNGETLALYHDGSRRQIWDSSGYVTFENGGSERLRIDSSGNLLVGKTATTLSVAGTYISATGSVGVTRASDDCLTLNRTGNNGAIASFYKDGTLVGSIGVIHNNNLFIGGVSHSGLQFGTSVIYPTATAGAANDAVVDLGASGNRFKNLYLSGNAYVGNAVTSSTDGSSDLKLEGNQHIFRKGVAGSYTERMRITSAGSVGIGTANPATSAKGLHVVHDANEGTPAFPDGEVIIAQRNFNSSQGCHIGIIAGSASESAVNFGDKDDSDIGNITYNHAANRMEFITNAAERMRIDSSGNLIVGKTSPINSSHTIYKEQSNNNVAVFENAGTSTPFGVQVRFTGEQTSRSDRYTYSSYHGTGSLAIRFGVQTDGGIANFSANNTNLSDRREKKNIEDADNTWSDVKQWSIRKYHYNIDENESPKKLGVIAQEIEEIDSTLVQPSFIDEQQNTERLYVKEQQMTWMAIKALQEAMIKIESLEARVTELES